jgi:hypothetical protein
MNQVVKQKWLEALRGSQYYQGFRGLKKPDGFFCCLGVLCDIHSREKGREWNYDRYYDSCSYLPVEVCDWAGFEPHQLVTNLHGFDVTTQRGCLSVLNDSEQCPFTQIADIIEQEL